jgi:glucose/arabinose dehydrogenase
VRIAFTLVLAALPCITVVGACGHHEPAVTSPVVDGGPDAGSTEGGGGGPFCGLPGAFVMQHGQSSVVPGGASGAPDLSWMTLPDAFCVHYFAHVGNARQLRFAPSGELFVASPTTVTSGGNPAAGFAGIVVLADDDHDGYADGDVFPHPPEPQALSLFLSGLPSTQGMLFAPGFFYYQDHTRILRIPYRAAERTPETTAGELVADITIYSSSLHWPKTLDMADDGTIYVGNGGDQGDRCDPTVYPRPFHGGVLVLDGTPGGTPVAQGFRNPFAVKCQRGHNHCFASELALDLSGVAGGREKLVRINRGDDWGFPCCATTNLPYPGAGAPNCASVAAETVSYVIGHTPFGFDFEPGQWPAPFTHSIIQALHGHTGTWAGARVVAVPTDPATGLPVPTSELDGGPMPPIPFASGWDDGKFDHGRPEDVAFAPDGRAFVGSDVTGDIVWIAPVGLAPAAR